MKKVFREATSHALQKWRKDVRFFLSCVACTDPPCAQTEMLGHLLERHVMDLDSLECVSDKFKSTRKEQINRILDLQTYIDGLVKHLNNTSSFLAYMQV